MCAFLCVCRCDSVRWVCYAEKTHPEALPHVSTAKSAQQVMGTLVKLVAAQELAVRPQSIYHGERRCHNRC